MKKKQQWFVEVCNVLSNNIYLRYRATHDNVAEIGNRFEEKLCCRKTKLFRLNSSLEVIQKLRFWFDIRIILLRNRCIYHLYLYTTGFLRSGPVLQTSAV